MTSSAVLAPRKGIQHRRARLDLRSDLKPLVQSLVQSLSPALAGRSGASSSAVALDGSPNRRISTPASNAATPSSAPLHPNLDGAAEQASLDWLWQQAKPYLARRPLEAVKCDDAHELAAVLRWYGLGIRGWAVLQRSFEALNRRDRTPESIRAAFATSFAAAPRDASGICGGTYGRAVKLESPEQLIAILEKHKERRIAEKRDAAAVMAMLDDKIAFVKRTGISTTFYIGFTGGILIDRIDTDEALSWNEEKVHGPQIELYNSIHRDERQETMIPVIVTGHWGPNGPSNPPPSVDTASLAEDSQIHSRNIENLMVAFCGKDGLMNLDDGGGSSRSAPHLVSGNMRGCLALDTILPLRRVRLRWSLDATDGHACDTERKHLVRAVPILLGRAFKDGEVANLPKLKNLLPDTATDVITKGKYQKAQPKSKDAEEESRRAETRRRGQAMGNELLKKLEGMPAVLVVCSLELHLVLRDCLANDDPPPKLLTASGWNESVSKYSTTHQTALLRQGVLYSPARKLWLLRAINSTKAKTLGHTATDIRAWAMGMGLQLAHTLEEGSDPAQNATVLALLGLLPALDFAYRLAIFTSQKLGQAEKARKELEGEGGEEEGAGEGAGSGGGEDDDGGFGNVDEEEGESTDVDLTNLPSRLEARRAEIAEAFAKKERDDEEARAKYMENVAKRSASTSSASATSPSTSAAPRSRSTTSGSTPATSVPRSAASPSTSSGSPSSKQATAAENKRIRLLNKEEIDRAAKEQVIREYGSASDKEKRAAVSKAANELCRLRNLEIRQLEERKEALTNEVDELAEEARKIRERLGEWRERLRDALQGVEEEEADREAPQEIEVEEASSGDAAADDGGADLYNAEPAASAPGSPSSKRRISPTPSRSSSPSKRRKSGARESEQGGSGQVTSAEDLESVREEIRAAEERLAAVEEVVEEKESRLWELEEQHKECEGEFAALVEQRAALAAEVQELEEQRREGKDAVAAVRNQGGALAAHVAELEQKRQKREDEVAAFGNQRDALVAEVGKLERQRRELEREVTALGDQRVAATAEVGDLEGKKGRLGSEVGELEAKKQNLGPELRELEARKAKLGSEAGELDARKDRLVNQVDDLEGKKARLTNEVGRLEIKKERIGIEVGELDAAKEKLGKEVSEVEGRRDGLEDEVGELEARKGKLEPEIGELEARKEKLGDEIEALEQVVDEGERSHAARLQEMEKETSQASASKDEVGSLLRDVEQRLEAMRLTADEEERKEEERQALRKRQREQDAAEDAEWEAARKRRRQEGQEADELAEKAREDDRKRADERARKSRADAATMADAHLLQQQRVLREQLDACIERHEKEIEEERKRSEAMIAEEVRRRDRRLDEIRNGT